jgi:hypothetical protein
MLHTWPCALGASVERHVGGPSAAGSRPSGCAISELGIAAQVRYFKVLTSGRMEDVFFWIFPHNYALHGMHYKRAYLDHVPDVSRWQL